MALIKCPECKQEISEYAESCPNCGCPRHNINILMERKNAEQDRIKGLIEQLKNDVLILDKTEIEFWDDEEFNILEESNNYLVWTYKASDGYDSIFSYDFQWKEKDDGLISIWQEIKKGLFPGEIIKNNNRTKCFRVNKFISTEVYVGNVSIKYAVMDNLICIYDFISC